jgi:hypothetical protein
VIQRGERFDASVDQFVDNAVGVGRFAGAVGRTWYKGWYVDARVPVWGCSVGRAGLEPATNGL